ncbi:MAG: nucleotide sugar dehydrogenase, partial [Desulfotomaculaceae bacterium]
LKILPGFYDLITGKIQTSSIREIQLEDLIGRQSVSLNVKEIAGYLKDRTILITGAGGSIGSELCRQLAAFEPGRLVLVGHGENSIYEAEMELRGKFPLVPLTPEIADIRDTQRIGRIFERYRPAVVFHAAAHKHVPLMENNPEEAVKNNILGTKILAEAAHRFNVHVFVLVSSDKAVNPSSIMGATKRVAEMVIQWMNEMSATRFVAVRFGNVLGSRGSAVPLFKKQIASGGPVTVTHPAMKRYFMTVTEAAQLVIQAGALARGGEIFILDMGEPVLILDLVKNLIKLSGYEPGIDISIQYTGVRQGEKLTESLYYDQERIIPTSHRRIYKVPSAKCCFPGLDDLLDIFSQKYFQYSEEAITYHLNRVVGLHRNIRTVRQVFDYEQREGLAQKTINRLVGKKAKVAVIGLGYVGLPQAVLQAKTGFQVTGIDIDNSRVNKLKAGQNYIQDVDDKDLRELITSGNLKVTTDFNLLRNMDVVVICVPTPLNELRQPDLSYITSAAEEVARNLQRGQLIILESTTFPGTTREIVLPILESGGLAAGSDFFLAFSPERVDPGNKSFTVGKVAKVIGGVTPVCSQAGSIFYQQSTECVVPVSSPDAAEMTKIFENTYRVVNIALVNEFMLLCNRMELDVWEILDAAATKPFGIQVFYPGPGVGGHCIPVDPFYLAWKARTFEFQPRFIELAGELNNQATEYVIQKTITLLNDQGKCLNSSKIFILGVAYKKDIDDVRESPALKIIKRLRENKATIQYHDPHVPQVDFPKASEHYNSVDLTQENLAGADIVLILTDHSCVNYQMVADTAGLIIDTRNATRQITGSRKNIIRI